MSSFNDINLFGSGPHRFSQAPVGEYILTNARVDPFQSGSQPIGPLDLTIIVRGRLIAETDDDLWALQDAIAALLTHPPAVGSLKPNATRSWDGMSFVGFAPADRTDRGRTFSIAYTATFVRFPA